MSAYLNTRVSLFKERIWPYPELDKLVHAADLEIPGMLKDGGLPTLAAGFGGHDTLSLESRIIAQLLEETRILVRPLSGFSRQFLIYWTERFEVSNVKTLLRAKMSGERPASVLPRLVNMGVFSKLDVDDLTHAEDVTELFRRLDASPYADIVRHARRAFEDSHDPFILEATLDRAYYEGLVRRARVLEKEASPEIRKLMADLIDRINLVWMMRYRFNYNLPAAQVYYLLVANGYRLNGEVIQSMVTQSSPEAMLDHLPESMIGRIAGVSGIINIFRRLENAAIECAQQTLTRGHDALSRAFAYLIIREHNLRSVRAVLRGRHLKLPVADIYQAIGREGQEAS